MVAEAVVDCETLISSIADEKAHQLGFRYWAYSAWSGMPPERMWSRHNLPRDLWSAYLQMLGSSAHGLPMRWDLDRLPDAAMYVTAPNDRLPDLLRRHDIGCGLQLPLYEAGELVATLVLASNSAQGNRARQVVFRQGLGMLTELHALCMPPQGTPPWAARLAGTVPGEDQVAAKGASDPAGGTPTKPVLSAAPLSCGAMSSGVA
jgi:hypothetical protein